MIHIFIPHRWDYSKDYEAIVKLLDRTKYVISDYSVPKDKAFVSIDGRYAVDPQIQEQIRQASVVVCTNRPAVSNGVAMQEIRFAVDIGKPVAAIQMTERTSGEIQALRKVDIIPYNKRSLENWIDDHVK